MPTVLLLDAAGTLIRTAEPVGDVYARHFREFGVSLPPENVLAAFHGVFAAIGPPDFDSFDSGHEAERVRWRVLVGKVLTACGSEAAALAHSEDFGPCFDGLYAHYAATGAWQAYPDTLPFLEAAAERARLVVVSNFDARLPPILEGLGLAGFFDHIVTSGEARASKPAPAIFRYALDAVGAVPHEAIHAGDHLDADVEGARAAGITAFHLDRPRQTLQDFLNFCTRLGL